MKKFHLHLEVSDEMTFNNRQWHDLKTEVLTNEEYKTMKWYVDLTDYEKDCIEDLR